MDEEYSVKENENLSSEFESYSEFNAETNLSENQQYSTEGNYQTPENQDYTSGAGGPSAPPRHVRSSRTLRTKIGRLLGMFGTLAGSAAAVVLAITITVLIDVAAYTALPESLEIEFSITAPDNMQAFPVVLSDDDGVEVARTTLIRENPTLKFTGLTPGGKYWIEVFSDGESKLRVNYILPEYEEPDPEDTGTTEEQTEPPSPGPDNPGAGTSPSGPSSSGGSGETQSPTGPEIEMLDESATMDSVTLTFRFAGIEFANLRATFAGSEATLTMDADGNAAVKVEGLNPETEYLFSITDASGGTLLSTTVTTAGRTAATVTEQSFSAEMTSASGTFLLENPDGNAITVQLDGQSALFTLIGNRISVDFDGLAEASDHVITFVDWDGTVILSYPFSTRARQTATVNFSRINTDLNSIDIELSINNPDENSLELRIDGRAVDAVWNLTEASARITGLSQKTTYTLTVEDLSTGDTAATRTVTTGTPPPTVTVAETSTRFDFVVVRFHPENIEASELRATFDGAAVELAPDSDGNAVMGMSGLTPSTDYAYTVSDSSGNLLLSGTVRTADRTRASVRVTSFTAGLNSASGSLTITNPDGNAITAKFDGNPYTYTASGNTVSVSFSNLAENSSHTLEFFDWDGTSILNYQFSTRQRQAATASFTSVTAGVDVISVSISITNPDGNQLELRLGGRKVTADLSGTTASAEITGLSPQTQYVISVYDLSTGTEVVSRTVTTETPPPSVSLAGTSVTFNSVTLSIAYENIALSDLRVKLNGVTRTPTAGNGGNASATFTGLNPDTSYTFTVTDASGTQLLSSSVRTSARTSVQMSVQSFTTDLTTASGTFSLTNPDGNSISAKLDGTAIQPTVSGSTVSVSFTGLAEGSSHTLVFYDYDGSTILSYPFTTRSRTHAQMSVQSFTSDLNTASGTFSLTNPDGNSITAKLNGSSIQPMISGSTVSVSFTGLAEGSSHTLVFYDYDGSTILSYPFTTRARTPATATFTTLQPGFNSISVGVSISNPDGNTLELRRGSTKINTDMTGSTVSATVSGLSPRTTYTISVYDVSVGAQVISERVTTDTTATWSQNTAGDVTFVYTESFENAYPRSSLSLTDEFGESVYVSMTNDGWAASAEDIIYGGTYTVALSYNGTQLDSFTITLTGEARPSFTMSYSGYGPATTAEALVEQTSSTTYPRYTYMLNSGYIPEAYGGDAPAGTTSSTERFTALFLINSSGAPVRAAVVGWSDCILTEVGELMEVYFNESQMDPEITTGTYTAAFWTVVGYSAEQIDNALWGQNGNSSNAESLSEIFWNNGRRISSYVTVSITITEELGYGYMYISSDPVASTNGYYYSFECSYSPLTEGTVEGFFTMVSASDPTVQLITPLSLGTNSTWEYSVSRQFVQSTSPVFAIIYSESFDPSNFLYVMYIDPANP